MKQSENGESGMLVVEATVVFPVMFLVIFLMIFAGNAYLQKCRIEAIVTQSALEAAAKCADPTLDNVMAGTIPSLDELEVHPYRYLIGGMDTIESEIRESIKTTISNMSSGLFSEMKPILEDSDINIKFNNYFIYSTFSVEIAYKVMLPVKLMGADDFIYMTISTRVNVPVGDSPEFIRNVDTVEDYLERLGVKEAVQEKITELTDKIKKWKDNIFN